MAGAEPQHIEAGAGVMRAGNLLIVLGAALLLIGLVARFAPWLISWFGRLPGDIRFESESTRVYIPITSMLLAGAALSGIVWLIDRVRG